MAVVTMVYGEGISHIDEVINLAVDHNLLDKSGAWFSYQGEKIGQGVASARSWLKSHPEIDAELTRQLREILFNPKTEEAQAAS